MLRVIARKFSYVPRRSLLPLGSRELAADSGLANHLDHDVRPSRAYEI